MNPYIQQLWKRMHGKKKILRRAYQIILFYLLKVGFILCRAFESAFHRMRFINAALFFGFL